MKTLKQKQRIHTGQGWGGGDIVYIPTEEHLA